MRSTCVGVFGVYFVLCDGFADAVQVAGAPSARAAGEEGAVPARRATDALEELLTRERQAAPHGGKEDVVREILDFMSDAAVLSRGLDEGISYGSQARHCLEAIIVELCALGVGKARHRLARAARSVACVACALKAW